MENYENNNVTPEVEEVVEETPVVEETVVAEENPYGQDFANYQTEYVSKEEILKNHETLKKKKGVAIGVLIYGIISVIIGLVSAGTPSGWMWIVFGILYITQMNKAEKEYASLYGA